MIKRLFLVLIGMLALAMPTFAEDLLASAEQLYRQGKFSQALSTYEQILKNYPKDPFVYYNIGNCYFKMGSKGLALANYYRAFKYAPRDADIRHNLALTRASCGEKFVPAGVPEVVHKAYFSLSLPELTGLAYLLFWICCLATGCWILKRKGGKFVLLLGLCTLFTAGWWYTRYQWENRALAVVASPVAEIRSGPGTNFPASASITQGHLVTIEDSKDNWYEVIVKSQSLKGWVEKDSIERI